MTPAPYYHSINLDRLVIPGNIHAAPMAGYTDRVCRFLALEGGADLTWTEMISAEALVRGSDRTTAMMMRAEGEPFSAVQLFGSNPEVLGRAAGMAREMGADLLDLNAGCPVAKVVGRGAGAALGRDPGRLREAVAAMRESGLPVGVKIRSGWDEDEMNWRGAAAAAVEGEASMIGFHPRTRKQGYGGRADRSLIKELVGMTDLPVIGSGDLNSPEDALAMLTETGCAGVMFARGAVGNPDIYRRTRALLAGDPPPSEPSRDDRLKAALRHLEMSADSFGAGIASREMKKHLAAYARGWEEAAVFRNELMRAADFAALVSLLESAIGSSGYSSR